ncbi:MAG: GNAT family N-acetyltransferase [Armatimonadetes bacterium]|nr:GNAT family N-acetyltransferase [Armatimonadota bacterium]
MILIREARKSDVPLIFGFIKELAEYEKLSHEVTGTEEQLDEHLFGPYPFAGVLIAEFHGVPVGFALYFHTYSTFLTRPGIYLEDIYVQPSFRGKGLGKALLKHIAAQAVRSGYGRMEWSVLDWNTPSIEFYESIGARGKPEWLGYRLDGGALAEFAQLG